MELVWEALVAATGLILSADPELRRIAGLSLAVSGTATLLAALVGVPLGVHRHLLAYDDPAVMRQELAADRLAVELLAPAALAVPLARSAGAASWAARLAALASKLADEFGLPTGVAEGYAGRLLRHVGAEPSFGEWLGLSNSGRSIGKDA